MQQQEPFRTVEEALQASLTNRGYNKLRDELAKVVKRARSRSRNRRHR